MCFFLIYCRGRSVAFTVSGWLVLQSDGVKFASNVPWSDTQNCSGSAVIVIQAPGDFPPFTVPNKSNSHVLQLHLRNVKFRWGKFSSRHFHRVSGPCCLCFQWFFCERSVWYIALMLKPRLAYDGVCLSCFWHRWELGNSLNVHLKMDLCRPLLQAKTQFFAFGCDKISTGSSSAFSLVMSLFNVAQCSLIVPSGSKVRPFYWFFWI